MTSSFQASTATLDLPREQIAQELKPIADLMADPTAKEIQVRHGGQHVFVEREGQAVLETGRTFPHLEDAIRTIAGASGRDLPPHRSFLTVRLEEFDARFSAILPPLARGGALMTIRRFPKRFTLDELVDRCMLAPEMATQLRADIYERRTIIVSGEGGSGKSTLVHALLLALPAGERMVILETNGELVSANPYITQLEASGLLHAFERGRTVHAPVDLGTLLEASLLHNPGRITIGEVTGPEALPLIMAWTAGHPGGFCTLHATTAEDALRRLAQCALLANGRMSYEALKADIARVVHISIHLTNRSGTRFVDQAIRVTGYDPTSDQFLTRPY